MRPKFIAGDCIIYLDNVLVQRDLDELWQTDLEGNARYRDVWRQGLEPALEHFDLAVLVSDLDDWRTHGLAAVQTRSSRAFGHLGLGRA